MTEHRPLLEYDTESALIVSENPYQQRYKRVLCVCSAGVLRSPTAALVLSQAPFNFNTRCAGIAYYALIPVTDVLLNWADEIVCMEDSQRRVLTELTDKPVVCLDIPDSFPYRDAELQKLIKEAYSYA